MQELQKRAAKQSINNTLRSFVATAVSPTGQSVAWLYPDHGRPRGLRIPWFA